MYHSRPRYCTLGHLQTTFKLSYLGCGPTEQSCAGIIAMDCTCELGCYIWLLQPYILVRHACMPSNLMSSCPNVQSNCVAFDQHLEGVASHDN